MHGEGLSATRQDWLAGIWYAYQSFCVPGTCRSAISLCKALRERNISLIGGSIKFGLQGIIQSVEQVADMPVVTSSEMFFRSDFIS